MRGCDRWRRVLGCGALLAIVSAVAVIARAVQPATRQPHTSKRDSPQQNSAFTESYASRQRAQQQGVTSTQNIPSEQNASQQNPLRQSVQQSAGSAQQAVPKQGASQQSQPQQKPQQSTKTPAPAGTIRTQVNEITTPVTVEDKKGNFLLGLTKDEFHVFDNGAEQQINRWGMDDHQLALALVVESSSHVGMMAKEIHDAGIVFTDMVMALSGEAAVISYGDTVDVRQAFTSDHDAVEKAVKGLQFRDDGMRLYDGMWQGAMMLEKEPDSSHRVLLVIGEAQDGGSKHKLNDILAQAQKANITIYTIGLSSTAADLRADPVPHSPDDDLGVTSGGNPVPQAATTTPLGVGGDMCFLCVAVFLVQRATHEKKNHAMAVALQSTGGAYYHPFKDRNIQYALNAIGNELHSQYVLSYQLQGAAQPGIHEIEVRVDRPHVKVRARLGYYLAPAHP